MTRGSISCSGSEGGGATREREEGDGAGVGSGRIIASLLLARSLFASSTSTVIVTDAIPQ